jgi:hypothetical protein
LNQTEKQHAVAIELLQRLGFDNVRLEAEGNNRFTYLAWTQPQTTTNGQVKNSKRGKIKVPA